MSGVYVGFGRILSVKTKSAEELGTENNLLELGVSVDTGERKKEGQPYAPSNIFSISVWGKRADALANYAEEGKFVFFKGHLAQPATYLKDGEARAQLKIADVDELKIVRVVYDSDSEESVEEKPAATTKASTKGKGKNKKTEDVTAFDTDIEDMDFS